MKTVTGLHYQAMHPYGNYGCYLRVKESVQQTRQLCHALLLILLGSDNLMDEVTNIC